MAVKLKQLKTEVAKVKFTVEIDGKSEDVDFAYYPNYYTPKLEQETKESRESNLAGEILIGMLVPLLAWIDLEVDDKGTKIEITSESLSELPISVLNDIMTAINGNMMPKKTMNDESQGSFKA